MSTCRLCRSQIINACEHKRLKVQTSRGGILDGYSISDATTICPRAVVVSKSAGRKQKSWCLGGEVKSLLHGPGDRLPSLDRVIEHQIWSLMIAVCFRCDFRFIFSHEASYCLGGMMDQGNMECPLRTFRLSRCNACYGTIRRQTERRSGSEV